MQVEQPDVWLRTPEHKKKKSIGHSEGGEKVIKWNFIHNLTIIKPVEMKDGLHAEKAWQDQFGIPPPTKILFLPFRTFAGKNEEPTTARQLKQKQEKNV